MPTPILMPQMGESIAEGTIVRWIKKVGDTVDRDEPLFEISTDKVDAEIPSPVAGILTEISAKEGETVAVNSVVGAIAVAGEVATPAPAVASASPAAPQTPAEGSPAPAASKASGEGALTPDEVRRQRSSPLVRRIARDNNVSIGEIAGSGVGGRVTKHDILAFIGDSSSGAASSGGPAPASARHVPTAPAPAAAKPHEPTKTAPGPRVDIQPMSVMRKKIAEHMIMSRRTSAHVHSTFHVNFSAVDKIRRQKKDEYERQGVKLTFMAFIAKAVTDQLQRHPIVNASLEGDNIVYRKDINIGIAVALEHGLIVPVIRNAEEKNLVGLARSIGDLATRARVKQLKPDDTQGGTFTITNPGSLGGQFGMPIINQPQLAILGVGTIEKRPVVIDDAIAIRLMSYLTLGFDHRLIDGVTGAQFMADLKEQLEHFDASQA